MKNKIYEMKKIIKKHLFPNIKVRYIFYLIYSSKDVANSHVSIHHR